MEPENPTPVKQSFMTSCYGDDKFSKERELSASMSIIPTSPDALENKNANAMGGE